MSSPQMVRRPTSPELDIDTSDELELEPRQPVTINARQTISLILYTLGVTLLIIWVAIHEPDKMLVVLGGIFMGTGIILGWE
jgi:uncharacterized BrkB/YihY/UPF0761 family membrane protein